MVNKFQSENKMTRRASSLVIGFYYRRDEASIQNGDALDGLQTFSSPLLHL